ncbi:MAG: invasion associated locus B family protein [Bauldia sp.]
MGMYDDETPRRRRSIVPILAIVAAILAVAVGIAVVLFALGYFDRPGGSSSQQAAATGADTTPPASTNGAQSLDDTTPSTGQTDVPKAVVSVAPPGQGEPPVRSTHGDWQVRCDTPAGAQGEQCVLMQFVTAEDRDNVGLTVIILKTADKKARIMRILAPLGVLLPSGLGLKIDATDMGRAGFVRCLPNGCVAEVILEDKLLTALRSGSTATFIIFQTPEEGIGIPISLNGFGPGYDALP